MRLRNEIKSFFGLYMALYLCLLVPLHLLHLDPVFQSLDRLDQTCQDECRQTPHHAGSCPTCQLSSGLIALPSHCEFSSVFVPISILPDRGSISAPACEPARPSLRAPPFGA